MHRVKRRDQLASRSADTSQSQQYSAIVGIGGGSFAQQKLRAREITMGGGAIRFCYESRRPAQGARPNFSIHGASTGRIGSR